MKWDIRREARAWTGEAMARFATTPEKTEMIAGRLYSTDEERLTMLALLLENVGADQAVCLGDPQVWRAAVAALPDETGADEQATWAPALPETERDAFERSLLENLRAQREDLDGRSQRERGR